MMKEIILWTVINMAINLTILCITAISFSKATNLGWQEIGFSVRRVRRRRRRLGFQSYIYCMDIFYQEAAYLMVITKKEYAELLMNPTGHTMAYVREFPNRFLNPDLEKYVFSLQELDWGKKDRRRCLKAFVTMFIAMEAIICMIVFEM